MIETPKCPYCGAEMTVYTERYSSGKYRSIYYCKDCESCAPPGELMWEKKDAIVLALCRALRRAEPENRVLTLEELAEMAYKDDWEFAWLERQHVPGCLIQGCPFNANEARVWFSEPGVGDEIFYDVDDYSKTWRCWLRKPTAEEMEMEKWEE